jgi:bifunctional DNase/RNase
VVVTSLRDNTFFAVIEMRNNEGDRMVLDSRPSDAIALALRADCPIYVDMDVIKASRNTMPTEEGDESELPASEEEWPDVIGEAGDLPM